MYKDKIFSSIASSEQQHMDQVLVLLNNYGLTDPASSERGVFENQVLQIIDPTAIYAYASNLLDMYWQNAGQPQHQLTCN